MASPQTKEFLREVKERRKRSQSTSSNASSTSSSCSSTQVSASISIPTSSSAIPSAAASSFSPSKRSSHSHEPTVEFYLSPSRSESSSTPNLLSVSAPTSVTHPSTTPPMPIYSTPTAALASDPEATRKNISYSERLVTFEGGFIKLFAQDGMELVIPREVAFHSEWMRRLLTPFPPSSLSPDSFSSHTCSLPASPWKERSEGFISLPSFRGEVLEKVVQYCFSDYLLNGPPPPLSPPIASASSSSSATSSSTPSAILTSTSSTPTSFPSSVQKSPSYSTPNPSSASSSARRKGISRLAARGSPITNTNVRRSLFRDPTSEHSSPSSSSSSSSSSQSPLISSTCTSLPTSSTTSSCHSDTNNSFSSGSSSFVTTPSKQPQQQQEEEDPRKERIVFCIDIGGDLATEVLMAAHYLSIRGLHDLACKMIAANIEGIETLVGLPPESVLQIFSYLPPFKLLYAEQHSSLYPNNGASTTTTSMSMTGVGSSHSSSPFFLSSSSKNKSYNNTNGFFNTGFLWKRAFEREGWGIDEYPYENSWKASLLKMEIHNDPAVCDIHPTIHELTSQRFICSDGSILTASNKKKAFKASLFGGLLEDKTAIDGDEDEDEDETERPLHESDIFGRRDEGIPWKHLYLQREFQNRIDRYFRTLDAAAASGASQYPSLRATLLTPRVEFGTTNLSSSSSSSSPSRLSKASSPSPNRTTTPGSTGGSPTVFSSALTSALSTAGVISHKSPPHSSPSSSSGSSHPNSTASPSLRVLEADFVGCLSIPSIVTGDDNTFTGEKEMNARKLRLSWAEGLTNFIKCFENLHFLDLSNHSYLFTNTRASSSSTGTADTAYGSLEGMLTKEGDALIEWLTSTESRVSSLRLSNCGLVDGFAQKLLELTSRHLASLSTSRRKRRTGVLAWISLDLSHNSLTSEGVYSLCQALFPFTFTSSSSSSASSLTPRLVSLSLADNKVRSSWRLNIENILSHLCLALSRSNSLRMLDLRRNELHLSQISPNALEALSTNSSLSYLLLDGNTFVGGQPSPFSSTSPSSSSLSPPTPSKAVANPDNVRTFLSYLPHSLQHLGLSNCGLSSIHLGFLVSSLNGRPGRRDTITSLDLSDNNFRDSGVFISSLLKQFQSLTSLDLGDSHLWDVGGMAIASSLTENLSLTHLNLERNTLRQSALAIASSVVNHKDSINLRTLNLDNNEMSVAIQNQVKTLLANAKIKLILNS